ncbi:DUF1259 domain-containing protein [Negadavirga shengliensis]|uniref:DUF1259 domain-containing protein n=1 Tax=Negadavirga shengliensis TaxID=1389218 RepID=A0ABV9T6N7_9BACT
MKIQHVYPGIFAASFLLFCLGGCGEKTTQIGEAGHDTDAPHAAPVSNLQPLDIPAIEKAIGLKGEESHGEYKVTVPQNDLDIRVDGFKIIPPMGLGSWAAFAPSPHGAMLMGDIIVTEKDLGPVQAEVISQGLTITAIHNHFVRNIPNVMYMHIGGMGDGEALARKVKSVLDKIEEVRGKNPSSGPTDEVENTLDTESISEIIGHPGSVSRGVYKITIGRPDVNLLEHGAPVSTFLGFNTWASWQGTPEKAAVAGDFTMLAHEVENVVKALIENGIEVVALHNHMVHEEPRIFFLHYWGVGPAEDLARGLRAALDQTGK